MTTTAWTSATTPSRRSSPSRYKAHFRGFIIHTLSCEYHEYQSAAEMKDNLCVCCNIEIGSNLPRNCADCGCASCAPLPLPASLLAHSRPTFEAKAHPCPTRPAGASFQGCCVLSLSLHPGLSTLHSEPHRGAGSDINSDAQCVIICPENCLNDS